MLITNRSLAVPLVALALVVLVGTACGGGDGGDSGSGGEVPPEAIEGGLPPDFPDDFPLDPSLSIRRSSPLGERYIIEASSEDTVENIANFYEEELAKGRWDLLKVENSTEPNSTTLHFTAPGFTVEGRVFVAEGTGNAGPTVVGIAMPMEAGEGND